LSYSFSDRVLVTAETEKDMAQEVAFRAGLEYRLAEQFYVRAGIGTNPTQNAFGFGMKVGSLRIDLASSFHHVLGYSPQAGIVVAF